MHAALDVEDVKWFVGDVCVGCWNGNAADEEGDEPGGEIDGTG